VNLSNFYCSSVPASTSRGISLFALFFLPDLLRGPGLRAAGERFTVSCACAGRRPRLAGERLSPRRLPACQCRFRRQRTDLRKRGSGPCGVCKSSTAARRRFHHLGRIDPLSVNSISGAWSRRAPTRRARPPHVCTWSPSPGNEQLSEISLGVGNSPSPCGHDLHHPLGDGTLEQFHQRVDLARALTFDISPPRLREGLDLDVHS